jgi:ABC-type multidrug transport system ATPase subunit
MKNASDSIIEVSQLRKSFAGFTAVDGLSFSVKRGDVYAFLGPNGAGKSTTIRMLLGLIKPDSGSITISGVDAIHRAPDALAGIGAMVEKPDFYGFLSAEENLHILAKLQPRYPGTTKIREMLHFVGLGGREKSKVKTFSQGMKQRLGFAQALLHDPPLLILDEPTNGLDPQGVIDIRNLIINLNKNMGKTIFISSHILSEMEIIANRMIIINRGKSIAEGPVNELLSYENLTVNIELLNEQHSFDKDDFLKSYGFEFSGHSMKAPIRQTDIPVITNYLVGKGALIKSITPLRPLEEFFLKMV